MGFQRAAADLEQLRVTPQALDRVLAAVAGAAHHLHRPVGDGLAHRRGEQLGRVGQHARVVVGADLARGVVGEALGGLGHRVAFGDVPLHLTELGDGLAERAALERVVVPQLEAAGLPARKAWSDARVETGWL